MPNDQPAEKKESNMSEVSAAMPRYQSIKKVWALQVASIEGDTVTFVGSRFSPRAFDADVFSRYRPVPGDYMVQYEDGYWSVSPKEPFEKGYVRL